MQANDLCLLADVKQWLGLAVAETGTIPSGSPYTVSVSKASSFTGDLGVVLLAGGIPLTQVTGTLATGQYSVAAGVYTFHSAQAGLNVGLSYTTFGVDDALIAKAITSVSESCRSYCQTKFDVETYTEYRSGGGWGQTRIFTKYQPIVSVTSLTIDDVVMTPLLSNIPDPNGSGYAYTENAILLYGYEFTKGQDNVIIVYSAGYATVPYDLNQIAVEWVCFKYREKDRIGHKSKTLAGETVAFITDDMPAFVKAGLQKYKRILPIL